MPPRPDTACFLTRLSGRGALSVDRASGRSSTAKAGFFWNSVGYPRVFHKDFVPIRVDRVAQEKSRRLNSEAENLIPSHG